MQTLPGVGASLERKLEKLGLSTVRDLLEHRPRRYVRPQPIGGLVADVECVVVGRVRSVGSRRGRGGLRIVRAIVGDESGDLVALWFTRRDWLVGKLQAGVVVRLRGRLRGGEFHVSEYELDPAAGGDELAPLYPASEELTGKRLRDLVDAALAHASDVADPLPAELAVQERLPLRRDAVVALHRPRSLAEAEQARARLAFDELLCLQVGILRRGREREQERALPLDAAGELIERYRAALPFLLTPYQEAAIAEIDADLARTTPMHRLLQGDVGSGKTVVALYALLRAVESGCQGALMAPTETLAEQHFLTIEGTCRALGVRAVLLTSALPTKEHAAVRTRIATGEAQIAVGTHALIQREVSFSRLGVAVVDEQHRFGVEQRKALSGAGTPHVLHMTATPIPRTLALTVYGDLAVSEIARPPANRKSVVTRWIPEERASAAYERLRRLLAEGRQAYVVCPLVEESEVSRARAAEQEAQRLRDGELRDFRVGCVHGRLKPAERRELMAAFKERELDVLVATTVIEVGVDVPNATVMIVQEADRFGLAQLHQLRGRVGRGAEQSFCLLVSRPKEELTETARERLDALERTADGFELAEVDLELRGAGELLGTRQSGLSDLRFVRLRADRALLERARSAAAGLLDHAGPLNDEVEALFARAALDA